MRRAAFPALASALLLVAAFVSCGEADPRYVYTAQRYDEAAGCLAAYSPVETVPGDSVSVLCPPTCMLVGDALYVSTVCPPLPEIASEVPPEDPACAAALDASRLEASCEEAEEPEEPDGGEPDDAGAGEDDAGEPDAGGPDAGPVDASNQG